MEKGAQAIKPGTRAMDQGVGWLKIGTRAGKPRTSGIVGSDGGPDGLRGSDGRIGDSNRESNSVTELELER